jgi:capsular polysaccharide transport system ATP-binding protein
MISVRNLTKSYALKDKRHYVFKDVSFDFPADKNIGILGPNGAGKSTLLRILGGIDHPDSGEIRRNASLSWPLGLRGGFVGHMTGRDNCRMICNAYGVKQAQLREKIDSIKALSQIGDYFDQPVAYYSSGMGSRLGFALSMAFDFDYFLIDEVTSVGDGHFKQLAKEALDQKRKTSKIIMVSHSMGDLKRFCDVAVLIKDGIVTIYEDFDKAIEAYLPKTAIKVDAKTLFKGNKDRADALLKIEETDRALGAHYTLIDDRFKLVQHALEQKEELGGRAADSLFKAASALLKMGHVEQALQFIERAIELDDCRVYFWYSRANMLWRLRRIDACLSTINQGLKLDASHPSLLFLKATIEFEAEQLAEAEQDARSALMGNPEFLGLWLLLAKIEMANGRHEAALDAIDQATKLNLKHPHIPQLKARILFKLGMHREALITNQQATPDKSKEAHQAEADELLTALENIQILQQTV